MELSACLEFLDRALTDRLPSLQAQPQVNALRLFNGFYEGFPELTVEVFGRSLVLYNYADQPETVAGLLPGIQAYYLGQMPWLQAVLVKTRRAADPAARRGVLLFGSTLDEKICEGGTWYALDLQMNQDASFYLDTRLLRSWLKEHCTGQQVLNTFAYTGSLGVAALAGGAARVIQTDLNPRFLEISQRSLAFNPPFTGKHILRSGDFFRVAGALRAQNARFDTVILDAPFFSKTSAGQVDLVNESTRLINKIRPLVAQNGRLIAINNALFLSGADYLQALQMLCADGYMEIETLISVPQDITGYTQCISPHLPADPSPFNHSTKIAILRLTRRN